MSLTDLLIGFLTGSSAMYFVTMALIRRHYQNIATIKATREELAEMISKVYHKTIYPELCRAEGLFHLGRLQIKKALKDCEMAEKPDHYRYIELVEKQLRETDQEVMANGIQETQRLKKRFKSILDKYHYDKEE